MHSDKVKMKSLRHDRSDHAKAGLSKNFDRQLAAYAMAAAAAGVGLLAAAPTAEAQIVYTPTNIVFVSGTVFIDINHDGVTDFALSIYNFLSNAQRLRARGLGQNGVFCSGSSGYPPLALKAGYRIGASGRYGTFVRVAPTAVNVVDEPLETYVGGPFANAGDRFLGLKFVLIGETHYGWALLRVGAGIVGKHPVIHTTLLGYAYNTEVGKPIRAGQREPQGEAAERVPEVGSLGMLALGWPARQRKEQDGTE
jgi:hypothetical protein